MTTHTIQGTGETIGKFSLKKVFKKVGDAFKKVGKVVASGLAKANPVLVAARAAVLKLVSSNSYGLADKFAAKGIDKARRTWEGLGGDFAYLQKAVEKGRGQRITGVRDLEQITGEDDDFTALMESVHGEPVGSFAAAADAAATALSIAKPILDKILGLLGIDLGGEAEAALKSDVEEATTPPPSPDGSERVTTRDQVRRLSNRRAMRTVKVNADDALNKNTGNGPGTHGMTTGTKVAIGAGAALALYLIFGREQTSH